MRICQHCGQPEAEALEGSTCQHEFDPPTETDEERRRKLMAVLRTGYPSAIANLRLMLENGRLAAVELATPDGSTLVEAEQLKQLLDAELKRRQAKSANKQGRGT